MTPAGLPHSDIHGSRPACGSPWLFAACYVLPRLPAPRHPPCALTALDQSPLSSTPVHLIYFAYSALADRNDCPQAVAQLPTPNLSKSGWRPLLFATRAELRSLPEHHHSVNCLSHFNFRPLFGSSGRVERAPNLPPNARVSTP
jgi:hypothetical protein